jgi:hypothetical protein
MPVTWLRTSEAEMTIKTLVGTVDGVNKVFTVPSPDVFAAGSFRLIWDGFIYPPDDPTYGYAETSSSQVTLTNAPPLNTVLQGSYDLMTAFPTGWSYSGNPSTSSKDLVRWLIGDTIASRPLLLDAEINAALSFQPTPSFAATACADAIANKVASKVDKTIGKTSIKLSQMVDAYRQMADRLRAGGAGNLPGGDGSGVHLGGIFVGGASISEDEALRSDSDLNQSSFSIGQDDHPGVPQNTRQTDPWKI